MGAVMPPRLGVETGRTGKNVPTLTRFTLAIQRRESLAVSR